MPELNTPITPPPELFADTFSSIHAVSEKNYDVFEEVSTRWHLTSDGGEIHRVFFVKPFGMAVIVANEILGGVKKDKRKIPAAYKDKYICNEVYIDMADENGITQAIRMGGGASKIIKRTNDSQIGNWDTNINRELIKIAPTTEDSIQGGAFITAIYKPLLSLYKITIDTSTYKGEQFKPLINRKFDIVDVQFEPIMNLITTPSPVKYWLNIVTSMPTYTNQTGTVRENLTVVTMRRCYVPKDKVPWEAIHKLAGRINESPYNFLGGDMTTIPEIPAYCLRFDGAEVYNKVGFFDDYCEILYKFTINETVSDYCYDTNGNTEGANTRVTFGRKWGRPGLQKIEGAYYYDGWYWAGWAVQPGIIKEGKIVSIYEYAESVYNNGFNALFEPIEFIPDDGDL